MKNLLKFWEFIINLLFPPRCSFCTDIFDWTGERKHGLCKECLSKISFIGMDACNFCGKKLKASGQTACECCQDQRIKVLSTCEYEGILREKLLELKFKGNRGLSGVFASFIIEKMKMTNINKFDIIISVPVHLSKLEERGYNQVELIAEKVAEYFSKPLLKGILVKKRPTESQTRLHKHQRRINVKDSFGISDGKGIRGKKILLVDDIITTGSTVGECTRILMLSGAEDVYVVTVAAGKSSVD